MSSCPRAALPSFSPPQALLSPRAFALLFPLPRMLGPRCLHGSPSPCRDVSGSTVSLERTFCSSYVNSSFLHPSLSSALFPFTAVTASDICIYVLLPPVESSLHWNRTWPLHPVPRPSLAHRVLLRLEEKEMETIAWKAPLLSLRLCQVPDSQVGLREAELPIKVSQLAWSGAKNPRI